MDVEYLPNPDRAPFPGAEIREVLPAGTVARVTRFHESLPGYRPTPLLSLDALARRLGVARIWVKDESDRFDLKAFKVLGASHAMARIIGERAGFETDSLTFDRAVSAAGGLGNLTFVTATDGNHGRAVAWTARKLGCRSVVYLPAGASRHRLEAIRGYGAEVEVVEGNFDDAVRFAARQSKENGWILMQDTAWRGYEAIPIAIMQGYTTLLSEAYDQMTHQGPTHLFVQAGVGSLAAALAAFACRVQRELRPRLIVVEPSAAACFFRSAAAGDRKPHPVRGTHDTVMAGLACGEPSRIAWPILRRNADGFTVCPDRIAIDGMRLLAEPGPGDPPVVSGESGAVTAGLVAELLGSPRLAATARKMKIDAGSRILIFSTEGDTDPALYRRIVEG